MASKLSINRRIVNTLSPCASSGSALKSARHFLMDLKFIKRPRGEEERIVNQNELDFIAFRSSLWLSFASSQESFSAHSSSSLIMNKSRQTFIFLTVSVFVFDYFNGRTR
jgi:hypothetical protein